MSVRKAMRRPSNVGGRYARGMVGRSTLTAPASYSPYDAAVTGATGTAEASAVFRNERRFMGDSLREGAEEAVTPKSIVARGGENLDRKS